MSISSNAKRYLLNTLTFILFTLMVSSVNATQLVSSASLSSIKLYNPTLAPPLKGSYGYALIKLDVEGTAPSFNFIELDEDEGLTYLLPGVVPSTTGKRRKVELKNLENGYYLFRVNAGLYQITNVSVPYFDLPYLQDNEFDRQWRFSVSEGKVNYIGNLHIKAQRSTHYVHVRLLNRIAKDQSFISNEFANLIANYPLVSGSGLRDEFYQHWLQSKGN